VKWRLKCGGDYFQKQGLECDKWSDMKGIWSGVKIAKWGEGRELRQGEMCSVYKGSEVEWGEGLGKICVIEYCIVWFTHYLVYLVVFNTDSSILGSTCFWVLIVCNMCFWFCLLILHIEGCLECCLLFSALCDILWCVLLCNIVLSSLAL